MLDSSNTMQIHCKSCIRIDFRIDFIVIPKKEGNSHFI